MMRLIIQGTDEILNVYTGGVSDYVHIPRRCELVKVNGKRFKVVDVELELLGNQSLKCSSVNIYLEKSIDEIKL